jgi:hypothetical protein
MSCNFELVCNDVDCGTVMELVHGGHMITKSAYNYRCPNDGCDNWTTIVIAGDGNATVEEPVADDTEAARLAGYVRRVSRFDLSVNLSMEAVQSMKTYKCSEGNTWLPLSINLDRLGKVLNGERVITTIVQRGDE